VDLVAESSWAIPHWSELWSWFKKKILLSAILIRSGTLDAPGK
jgi:hypothetical protein